MNKCTRTFIAFLSVLTLSGALFAQVREADKKQAAAPAAEKPAEQPAVKPVIPIEIKVLSYLEWSSVWGNNSTSFDRIPRWAYNPNEALGKNNNTFAVKRVYLDFQKKFGDIFNARVTTDVDASITTGSRTNFAGTAITQGSTATNGNHLFLKYAYIEAKKDFGPVWLGVKFGKIDTPVIGLIDKISDYRWINNNYLDASASLLDGQKLDNSADLGARLDFGIMKYVTTSWTVTNGEGFGADEVVGYKAVTGLLSITPIQGLYLNGFGRYEINAKYDYTGVKTKRYYYGYGVAYSSDAIKVGVNHIMPYVSTVGVASKFNAGWVLGATQINLAPLQNRRYAIVDAWLNANLGAIVPTVPLLLTGRFAYGYKDKTYQRSIDDPDLGKSKATFIYGLGLGWKFNSNFRILLGGEYQQYYVKKNVALRVPAAYGGVENNNSGTDNFKAGAVAGSNFYTGSHNVNDTKRLYVKAEVSF